MRQEIPLVILGADGRPFAGASVYVRTSPSGADATVYQARTGGATSPNPLTSDAQGRVSGWLERGDYAATIASVSGLGPWVEEFPIGSQNDGHIDLAELPVNVGPTLVGVHSARPAANTVRAGTRWISSDKWMEWLSDGAAWTLLSAQPQPVTAIPPTAPAAPASPPVDGQRISLKMAGPMTTQNVRWGFRYDAASARWELEDGPFLRSNRLTASSATTGGGGAYSNTLGDGANAVSLVAPVAAVYDVEWTAIAGVSGGTVYNVGAGVSRSVDVNPPAFEQQGASNGGNANVGGTDRIDALTAANDLMRLVYLYAAIVVSYSQRSFAIRPVYVPASSY